MWLYENKADKTNNDSRVGDDGIFYSLSLDNSHILFYFLTALLIDRKRFRTPSPSAAFKKFCMASDFIPLNVKG